MSIASYLTPSSSSPSNKMMNEIDGTLLGECNDGCYMYATTWKRLQNIQIKNWEYNRPADMVRIPDIAKQLKKQNYLDGFIYLVKAPKTERENTKTISTHQNKNVYYCYDGIHRIEALRYLSNDTTVNNDHKIVVHVYYDYDEMEIKRKFETLNKCIPVPEIYTKAEQELNMKKRIDEIVNHFYKKYIKHFSSNRRANIPNENRDIFIEKMTEFFQEHNELLSFHSSKLIEMIEQFNLIMKEKARVVKMTRKQYEKCCKNNCFLFIRKNWSKTLDMCYMNSMIRVSRV